MKKMPQTKALVVRSKVEPKKNYLDYKQNLRFDFLYSCAYCSITEIEAAGIGFEIDHYYPKKNHRHLINDYGNLMYSCRKCNAYKSDFDPTPQHKANGYVVIRPDQDDPTDHYDLDKYTLIGKTSTGYFNVELLDLNRRNLRRLREIREKLNKTKEYLAFGLHALISIRIDRIPREKRLQFIDVKNNLVKRDELIKDKIETVIRDLGKSPMLDEDKEKIERQKKRRDYLRQIKAITPF